MQQFKTIQFILAVCITMAGCVIEAPPEQEGGGGAAASGGSGGVGGNGGNGGHGGVGGTVVSCDQPDPISCSNAGCFWTREGCGSEEPENCVGLNAEQCTSDVSCIWSDEGCGPVGQNTACEALHELGCVNRPDCFATYVGEEDCGCGGSQPEAPGEEGEGEGDAERVAPAPCSCGPVFAGCEPMNCDGRNTEWCEVDDRCVVVTEVTCGGRPFQENQMPAESDEAGDALPECFDVEVDVCRPAAACGQIVDASDCGARPNCHWGARPECDCNQPNEPHGEEEPDGSEGDRAPIMYPEECAADCYACQSNQPESVCDGLDYFQCDNVEGCRWEDDLATGSASDSEGNEESSGHIPEEDEAPARLPAGTCVPQ